MSSYLLNQASVIKALTIKFRIANEVYDEAYAIYDFRNSGKKDFTPDLSLLNISNKAICFDFRKGEIVDEA